MEWRITYEIFTHQPKMERNRGFRYIRSNPHLASILNISARKLDGETKLEEHSLLPRTIQEQFGIEDGPVGHKVHALSMQALTEGTAYRADALTSNQKEKLHLATIIERSLQREIFVRIQKNLILIKVLADSTIKLGMTMPDNSGETQEVDLTPKALMTFQQAVEQIRASQRRVSAVFAPLVFQLYPEQVETITLYMADATMACATKQETLPIELLNEIELPKVQKEFSDANETSSKTTMLDAITNDGEKSEDNSQPKYLRSKEYYLFLSAIYLSETIEQLETTFGDEVEKLTKLIRPEITAMENACSKIHKIYTKHGARQRKWSWTSDFKTI